MRAKKATGALVVSLILLFVMIGVQVGTALTLGTQMWNIANPKAEVEEPVTAPDVDENTDWVGDIEIEAPLHDSEVLVSMELVYMDDECGAVITGILPDGGVWEYVTDNYEVTELDPITELHCFNDKYLFCAGGAVYALDVYTGKELWVNYDFGGYSPVFHCDGDGTIFLSGFYGPDVFVMDADGNTIAREEQINSDYWWPIGIHRVGDTQVEIAFDSYPDGASNMLVYDYVTGTAGEANVEGPAEALDDSWRIHYMELVPELEAEGFNYYSLVHVDADGYPELVAHGNPGFMVTTYDEQNGNYYAADHTVADMYFSYIPESGIYESNYYDNGNSSRVFYKLTGKEIEKIVAIKYVSEQDGSYTYYIDGKECDADAYYNKETEVTGNNSMQYCTYHTKNQMMEILENWYNPTKWEDAWKEGFANNVEYSSFNGYRLLDVDENGVPEMFAYALDSYGEYTYVYFCDPQTRQIMMAYGNAAKDIVYLPENGLLCITYDYGDSLVDHLYQVSDHGIVQIACGDRNTYGGEENYFDNYKKIDKDSYMRIFSPLVDSNAVCIDKNWVSKENMMEKLQN